mgnify:CR=1 FL=1
MNTVLLIANTLCALLAVTAALLALMRPELMLRAQSVSTDARFYTQMYAARAIPFGLTAALAPFFFHNGAVRLLLIAFALTQIGWRRREWGMVIFPGFCAAVHLAAAHFVMV